MFFVLVFFLVLGWFFFNEWIDSLFLISEARKFKLFGVGVTCHVLSWYNVRLMHCKLFPNQSYC